MRVRGERLGRGAVWFGEGGDELHEGEVADCFGGDGGGNFDGDGDAVVGHARLEFVGIARDGELLGWWEADGRAGRAGGGAGGVGRHALLDHGREFLYEHVVCRAGLEDGAFKVREARHQGEVHGVDSVEKRFEGLRHGRSEVFLQGQ